MYAPQMRSLILPDSSRICDSLVVCGEFVALQLGISSFEDSRSGICGVRGLMTTKLIEIIKRRLLLMFL